QFVVFDHARLYVVVTFALWEVRCRRAMHSDRDSGSSGLVTLAPLFDSDRRQVKGVVRSVIGGRPLTDVVPTVQHGKERIRIEFTHWKV
ncbi:hypothetical protein EDB86DRAFT_2977701, partial [Lactarius hatsudake]